MAEVARYYKTTPWELLKQDVKWYDLGVMILNAKAGAEEDREKNLKERDLLASHNRDKRSMG